MIKNGFERRPEFMFKWNRITCFFVLSKLGRLEEVSVRVSGHVKKILKLKFFPITN